MTDRPIIFSGPMVRALLAGRKTMTRRLALTSRRTHVESTPTSYRSTIKIMASPWQNVKIGDRLWVRENAMPAIDAGGSDWRYAANYDAEGVRGMGALHPWRPSIHMPRVASRMTLIVFATKIERLWDISEQDCQDEGVVFETADPPFWYVPGFMPHSLTAVGIEERADLMPHAVQAFRKLWILLHGRDGWESNPEVVALSFRIIKSNIDLVPA